MKRAGREEEKHSEREKGREEGREREKEERYGKWLGRRITSTVI